MMYTIRITTCTWGATHASWVTDLKKNIGGNKNWNTPKSLSWPLVQNITRQNIVTDDEDSQKEKDKIKVFNVLLYIGFSTTNFTYRMHSFINTQQACGRYDLQQGRNVI